MTDNEIIKADVICGECLWNKNCQFLAKHKSAEVEGCTAFVSEADYISKIKNEAYKEFAERLNNEISNNPHSRSIEASYERFRIKQFIDHLVEKLTEGV